MCTDASECHFNCDNGCNVPTCWITCKKIRAGVCVGWPTQPHHRHQALSLFCMLLWKPGPGVQGSCEAISLSLCKWYWVCTISWDTWTLWLMSAARTTGAGVQFKRKHLKHIHLTDVFLPSAIVFWTTTSHELPDKATRHPAKVGTILNWLLCQLLCHPTLIVWVRFSYGNLTATKCLPIKKNL